jgi:hypothetical protein
MVNVLIKMHGRKTKNGEIMDKKKTDEIQEKINEVALKKKKQIIDGVEKNGVDFIYDLLSIMITNEEIHASAVEKVCDRLDAIEALIVPDEEIEA